MPDLSMQQMHGRPKRDDGNRDAERHSGCGQHGKLIETVEFSGKMMVPEMAMRPRDRGCGGFFLG